MQGESLARRLDHHLAALDRRGDLDFDVVEPDVVPAKAVRQFVEIQNHRIQDSGARELLVEIDLRLGPVEPP